jgi:hypothetical protein
VLCRSIVDGGERGRASLKIMGIEMLKKDVIDKELQLV